MLIGAQLQSLKKELLPVLLLAGLAALFVLPFIAAGKVFLLRDLCTLFYPENYYYREALLDLQIPLWNPYTGCGEPFLADIQTASLYPLKLVYLVFPVFAATAVFAALHFFIAGAGTYFFCRVFGVSAPAAALAGVAYAFSPSCVTKIDFPNALSAVAWYPLILALFFFWSRTRKWWTVPAAMLAFGMQLLAGWPEAVFFTSISIGIYVVCAAVHDWLEKRTMLAVLVPFLTAGAVVAGGIMLAMAQLLPTAEFIPLSGERHLPVDPQLWMASITVRSFFSLFIPSVYGVPGHAGMFWAPTVYEYWLGTFYVGILPVTCVCLWLIVSSVRVTARAEEKEGSGNTGAFLPVIFLAAVLVFAFLYAMGKYTPVFSVVWNVITAARHFRWPSKILFCVVFSLACLAGFALDRITGAGRTPAGSDVRERAVSGVLAWAGTGMALCALFVAAVFLYDDGRVGRMLLERCFNLASVEPVFAHRIPWKSLVRDAVALPVLTLITVCLVFLSRWKPRLREAGRWLCVAAAFADLAAVDQSLIPAAQRSVIETPSEYRDRLREGIAPARFFTTSFPIEYAMLYGERSPDVYRSMRDTLSRGWAMVDHVFNVDPLSIFGVKELVDIKHIVLDPGVPAAVKENFLKICGCDRVILFPDLVPYFVTGVFGPVKVVSVNDVLPRAYVVGGATVLRERQEVFQAIAFGRVDFLATALTDRASAGTDTFADLNPGRVNHVIKKCEYGINQLDIEMESFSKGLLVVSDTWYPGWYATVNGVPARIYKVNGAFRGVRVPAGRSTVVMTYEPFSFRLGALISIASLCVVLVLLLIGARRRGVGSAGGAG